jgi:hypothetical protein
VTVPSFTVPVELGRDEAQRLARLELANPQYQHDDESLVSKAIRWILDRISELMDRVSSSSPQFWLGVVGVVVVVLLLVVAIRRRTGPLERTGGRTPAFEPGDRSAAEHRAEAERLATSGAWAEAVRERLRAVVRDLEDRGLVDARPGRTADEIARDAGAALPSVAAPMRDGARYFDDVWYGGRPADADGYRRLVELDDAAASARPGARAGRDDVLAVPR